jgi:oligopeptidase B
MKPPKEKLDPYYWLRDDSRKSPEVIDFLRAENEYCQAKTAHLTGLQKELYTEILSHLQETDADVPYKRGDFLYYTRTVEGLAYKIHCRKPATGVDSVEQVVIDENEVRFYRL